MKRSLHIKSFKNIGFKSDGTPTYEKIVLNHSLELNDLGDLVILLGLNNSGKSNVLTALERFQSKEFKDNDFTNLFMNEENQQPVLSLQSLNGNERFAYSIHYNGQQSFSSPKIEEINIASLNLKPEKVESLDSYINNFNILKSLAYAYARNDTIYDFLSSIDVNTLNENNYLENFSIVSNELEKYLKENPAHRFLEYLSSKDNIFANEASKVLNCINKRKDLSSIIAINNEYKEKYGYDFIPQIITYKDSHIRNQDLTVSIDYISSSLFFKKLFKNLNYDIKRLSNIKNQVNKYSNIGFYRQEEDILKEKLQKISTIFNNLYLTKKEDKYNFEIFFDSGNIFFVIKRDNKTLILEQQSVGFRRFFDLFFNVICSNSLSAGDIIVMDEAGTPLHPSGQEELRRTLKEFAINNSITIILATQSPFLVDLDYLDEIRFIKNENCIASIQNDFSTIDCDAVDKISPIASTLTVKNHVIMDPDKTVIFVEGITDYNYCIAMKQILREENYKFLPISGIRKTKDQQIEISKNILKIKKLNPILLVDGDGAGKAMKKLNSANSNLKVIALTDIDPSFKEIESLFSIEDLKKLGLLDAANNKINKSSNLSSTIKNKIIKDPSVISETTLSNFKKFFLFLKEELE